MDGSEQVLQEEQTTTLTSETPSDTLAPVEATYRVFVRWGDSSGWLGTEHYVVHQRYATIFATKREAEAAFRDFKKAKQASAPGTHVEHTIEEVS